MEVLTFTDKQKRDEVFARYRIEGDGLEREVVKFSDVTEISIEPDADGNPRSRWVTIFCFAYPSTPRYYPSRRNRNYERVTTAMGEQRRPIKATGVPDLSAAA